MINEIKEAAKAKFPTLKKCYPSTIRTVKNRINGQPMYLMNILLDNGGRGMAFTFSMYVNKELRKV